MTEPLPIPTPVSQPFWDALREHRIVIQYSPSAEKYVFYPRTLAPGTLTDDLEWREIDGAGTLYTYTVARRPTGPPWADQVPSCSRSSNGTWVRGSAPNSSTSNPTTS